MDSNKIFKGKKCQASYALTLMYIAEKIKVMRGCYLGRCQRKQHHETTQTRDH